ncbi:sensor histidine kinase [Pseudaestuariivita atlantica]|uniref:histidine kinase n=1 Tax=Pseudaestuariivita atlantica TaxID=1317121 RepID=A0A0L1JKR0_9RHOB|nr:HAMP domain-containing sensor histidine kinase [Pseudaestuariivita atlantica]KNG92312.1 ATPase [Pseudaestuariivita atlantica]
MFNSLSGRFLILTTVFVFLAEVLIFVPSVARYREDYLLSRLERAQIASLTLLAADMIDADLEEELLRNAGVFNIVLRRDEARQLILSAPMPVPVSQTYDMRDAPAMLLIRDALSRLVTPEREMIRVIGTPVQDAGLVIEATMDSAPLRAAMIDYGLRILALSAIISIFTATLLFLAVRVLLVKPITGVVEHMQSYAAAPEDARRIIQPSASVRELREAEEALQSMQTQLTASLRQRERLAQLGEAVAKVSHDLRNILTSAQLFTDRIEQSEDPAVRRMAPKLVNSIRRAVSLCESTLAFGRADEPAPKLTILSLSHVVDDVFQSERLAVGDYDLTFVDEVPPMLDVRGDPEQLYRALGNLVRNARQVIMGTGKPGTITISAREDDANWIICVRDNGPGFPPKARENLFKAFAGGARKGGTGLGLTIVQELIRGHGGSVDLVETGEEGTVFEISLPKGALISQV